jgi:hypothetical protein
LSSSVGLGSSQAWNNAMRGSTWEVVAGTDGRIEDGGSWLNALFTTAHGGSGEAGTTDDGWMACGGSLSSGAAWRAVLLRGTASLGRC